MAIATISPFTGEVVKEFRPSSPAEIECALTRGQRALAEHRAESFAQRATKMLRVADLLEEERWASLITLEMGKLLGEARAEIEKCARCCRYYAGKAEEFLRERPISSQAQRSFLRHEPLGMVLAIMPWNFPYWQVIRFAAPALMAGNVVLLKHAVNVPQCALALSQIFEKAGFAEGVFQTLLLESDAVAPIIADERIRAVTLTGSDRAGSSVATAAGRALKKCVLELGGSDAFIVMPSADLRKAVETGIKARMINAGQSCIAAKRFFIARSIYDAFVEAFVEKMKSFVAGDPLAPETTLAPLATPHILEGVEKQVAATVAAGARVLSGGKRIPRPGNFFEATVLTDIPAGSSAAREEIFGPVASIFRVEDAADAVRQANESPFGLGASVWTNDPAEQEFFARELESGMVFVNALVASDPALPFGGVKRSGYGRELGPEGIREFTNAKTVYIA